MLHGVHDGVRRQGRRGMVLVLALALLSLLLVIGMILLSVGQTETQVADRNLQLMQALHTADAMVDRVRLELNHRLDADTSKSNFNAELANSGYLRDTSGNDMFGSATTFATETIHGQAYSVRVQVTDNNDEVGTQNLLADGDRTVWVNATSRYVARGHTVTRRVRALVGPTGLSAFTMGCPSGTPAGQQTLLINGNPSVMGSQGSVHSNCNLTTTGNADFAENLSAVGDLALSAQTSVGGRQDQDASYIPIPTVNPADFKSSADYILRGDGKVFVQTSPGVLVQIYDAVTGTTTGGGPAGSGDRWPSTDGWRWTGGAAANWDFSGNQVNSNLENKMVYFEKAPAGSPNGTAACNVSISGSPPTGSGSWKVSVVAEGHIDVSGSPNLRAADGKQNLLLVAGTDIKIGGAMSSTFVGGGVVAAHEQIDLHGTPEITGFFLAENGAYTDGFVASSEISGNPQITYNGLPSPPMNWRFPLRTIAWQQVE